MKNSVNKPDINLFQNNITIKHYTQNNNVSLLDP